jgi:hypothetical protein
MAGTFLPWAHVTVFRNARVGSSFSLDPSGWRGDGNVVFALGAAAAVIGVVLLWWDYGRLGVVLRSILLLCGLAIAGVTFWDTTHVSERFSYVAHRVALVQSQTHVAPRVATRISYGIVLSAAGGVMLVFAAVIDRFLADEQVIVEDD